MGDDDRMYDDLLQFLRARLDEEKRRVLSVGPAKLGWGTYLHPNDSMGYTSPVASVDGDDAKWVTAGEATHPDLVTVVFDPQTRLAEIEAKRALLDWHKDDPVFIYSGRGYVETVLKCLAVSYSDHPDYREEWRPDTP